MEEELKAAIEDASWSDDLNEDLCKNLEKSGFEFISDWDIDEKLNLGTNKTSWETKFKAEKDGITWSVYLDGTARAEFSYENWVGSGSYYIETIHIQEI